ncbi:methylenetetrahydrofolate--tRNA-(uracil-5-)-methyltransferase [Zymomonas mobilis]|uniref:methylenetetrahydrofolate--tRNA-(uracil(54)- C(5))-methyltransferase (FADH(2)-oxidizing) TrmFO n=1 Tax=Zymomonas mobilis TaxID=542 RepID=UPI00026D829C|nr:methylenetetrahydrofolate--tRNA-(uracil(54)-C(5))-methyltransferase (FADH(2)-oxidizing) TrmFO [Zymomonas mobilis]AFN56487.1 Methylenetetrahydrofolate--tRNA-(uracil-5-)-methyltransferase trmFO [Zymomonas mobilis subsp. mobilis ATCC 29191]TQK78084.1 methylenetetrahydrofolate--tRNA-(uracil-5-)-methyltransferase [Zymomonas mobilis]TQL15272.1 methylenetetrahydrofolate--tRNA-(uracil-5-)-methyltransferase [Zymomonas mobilis]GEB86668.1 methylenetetrahydrofolate--tRNA-(uracil-5-)-methyltransferase Tr
MQPVNIIGGGLAGSEAAWQLASRQIPVRLFEMRGREKTPAHSTDKLAELVCSNSFRSDDPNSNAVGVLHAEMRKMGSLIMMIADQHRVPAGSALAVDREGFAEAVTNRLQNHPLIEIHRERIDHIPDETTIIASGPLTSDSLANAITELTGRDALSFFDAIAPIVYRDSIDMDIAWFQSRWDKGDGHDYINCPLNKEEYLAFHAALLAGEKGDFHEWEKDTPYFEGCMPIEVMADRGIDTLRFGPMKPVGLDDPRTGRWPYGAVQLRQDNALGTLWNMVGFQTKLKYAEQIRIFRMIPGLEKAEFARLGGMHRNSFIRSPVLLDEYLRLKKQTNIRFAGQITGCEGYIESASIGLLAGIFTAADKLDKKVSSPPVESALGALLGHITKNADPDHYQPMNINFGLFPPISEKHPKKQRKAMMAERARKALDQWISEEAFLKSSISEQ